MSPFRPDIVDVWIFRERRSGTPGPSDGAPRAGVSSSGTEVLLLRRSSGRILPGLWQCVSGRLEPAETVPAGALRELREETGLGPEQISGFYDLDQVNQFYEPSLGGVVTGVIFAVRLRGAAEPVLSHEHDAMRWVPPAEALELAVCPAYRESIRRIVENLLDPEKAVWFELTFAGERARQ